MGIDLTEEPTNDDSGEENQDIYNIELNSHNDLKRRTMYIDKTGEYSSTSSDSSNLVIVFVLGGYIHAELSNHASIGTSQRHRTYYHFFHRSWPSHPASSTQ